MRQVIYHAECRDGWCAAWVALKKYPDAQLVPGVHGKPPPDVRGNDVLLVDFCYRRSAMEQLISVAKSVTVFEHHLTAAAALHGLQGADITFDMKRSGAGITWDVLFPGEPRPWLVSYVEDRDIWTHALPDTLAINAYLSTMELSVEAWDREMGPGRFARAIELGAAIQSKIAQYVIEVHRNTMRINLDGHDVPIVNASYVDISDVLAKLCEGEPFAIGWHQKADGSFYYSMRSKELDVAEIAERRGGGGHRHAASFRLPTLLTSK